MFVIIGLGNPGKQYAGTRHNVGFDVIDYLSEKHSIPLNKVKFKGLIGEGMIANQKALLVKPQTYMNLSGQTVLEIQNFYKLNPEQLIVIYDDIDVDPGKLRIRSKGSAGTHNGMRSIIYEIQSDQFPRVRIGVGKPQKGDLSSHVLGKFAKEDREEMDITIGNAAKAVETIVAEGVDAAMNKFNG